MTIPRPAVMFGLTLALLTAPLAVEAQPALKVWRIGLLLPGSPLSPPALLQGLRELGDVEGQNLGLTIPPAVLARADEVIE